MKFEKDLAREILLALEADQSAPDAAVQINHPGHSRMEIAYHVQLLNQAGFIEAAKVDIDEIYDWNAKCLTYQGHEFLDTVRDSEIWRRTKDSAAKAGAASVQILFSVATALAKQKLAELGVAL